MITKSPTPSLREANIARILNEPSFTLSVRGLTSIHKRIFTGIFKHAGIIRDYEITKNEWVQDLTSLPSLSYWGKGDIGEMEFLQDFSKEVSRPIERDDRIHIEYLPTQAFTEYIRYRFQDNNGSPVDGIMFNSSIPNAGKNVVLFCNKEESSEYVELTDFKIYP